MFSPAAPHLYEFAFGPPGHHQVGHAVRVGRVTRPNGPERIHSSLINCVMAFPLAKRSFSPLDCTFQLLVGYGGMKREKKMIICPDG